MENKKPTRGQLEKRIKNAQLLIDKGSQYKAIFFGLYGL